MSSDITADNSKQFSCSRILLVTDLDGTFLPEQSAWTENVDALQAIRRMVEAEQLQLAFATGRHLSSVERAIESFRLPVPNIVICDVGTTIYHRMASTWEVDHEYVQAMRELQGSWDRTEIIRRVSQLPGVKLQEPEKNSEFKLSFYSRADQLEETQLGCEEVCRQLEMAAFIVTSVDPSGDVGLIDLLPHSVSKSFAVEWLNKRLSTVSSLVYAGDSGNDLSVFQSGCPSILVGNATPSIAQDVASINQNRIKEKKVYCASGTATSGVLEGLRFWSDLISRACANLGEAGIVN